MHVRRKDLFPGNEQKDFSSGTNSGEISIYQLDINKKHFSTKNLIGKYQILKSRGAFAPLSSALRTPSDSHACMYNPVDQKTGVLYR